MSTSIAAGESVHATVPRLSVSAVADQSQAGEPLETRTVGQVTVQNPVISARMVNVYYGEKRAIKDVKRCDVVIEVHNPRSRIDV
jgi:hypothetical protein